MTREERIGMEMVKSDHEHIFRLEDKGSCIVRLRKEDYANNAEINLHKGMMYEELVKDPSKETEKKVIKLIEKLERREHIEEKTAEFIKSKTEGDSEA